MPTWYWMFISSNCVCSRSFLSSALSGSSSSKHFRAADERARERHPLPLASGELVRLALGERRELHHVEGVLDALRRTRSSSFKPPQTVTDVLLPLSCAETAHRTETSC